MKTEKSEVLTSEEGEVEERRDRSARVARAAERSRRHVYSAPQRGGGERDGQRGRQGARARQTARRGLAHSTHLKFISTDAASAPNK